jgi:hypothetical protein
MCDLLLRQDKSLPLPQHQRLIVSSRRPPLSPKTTEQAVAVTASAFMSPE